MNKIISLSFVVCFFIGNAQTKAPATIAVPVEKEWDVSMYGFIRTDCFYDSRKSVTVRESQLNLYPLDAPATGDDFNAVSSSNFLAIVSRLGVKVKGPNVWGAKMNGTLEGDFFGNTEGATSSVGMFRLRHAFVTMDWSKTQLTIGQTWYPTFIPEVFPGVANFNTGIMFNPFGWATQVKLKQNVSKELSFAITAYKEREFTATPSTIGTQNSASINAVLPTLHGQFQFKNKKWIAGIGGEIKSIQPLTDFTLAPSGTRVVTSEKVNSTSFMGYFKYSNDYFSLKAYGISGSNLQNFVMIGGFVGYNVANQVECYKATKTTAYWLDLASNGKKIAPGLFFGYTSNGGTGTAAKVGETAKYYMRGISGNRVVDNVMRLSGRVDFKQNKFRVTPEVEYTTAKWGDFNVNGDGTADLNVKNVSNMRVLISCVYSF